MRHLFAGLLGVALAAGAAEAQTVGGQFVDRDGREVGSVTLQPTASGRVLLKAEATGLPPGPHGFHVHETGACDPATGFDSAGGHLAHGREHGVQAEGGPHPGDFPNVHAGQDGVMRVEFFADRELLEGERSLLQGDGAAVIIHADPDDYASQPSGKAGNRIACAVLSSQ